MLSRIDEIIYPNRCEVYEVPDPQRFVYPIFKNGSSSITYYGLQNGYKVYFNQQLAKLDLIHVVLRNPLERYLSGIKTFAFNTKTENPSLDLDTILWFAENYLFLNRHYAPQLSWLINLNRYTRARLKFCSMDDLHLFSPAHIVPSEDLEFSKEQTQRLSNNIHNEPFLKIDNLLLDFVGKEATFQEVLDYIKDKDKIVFQKLQCVALD